MAKRPIRAKGGRDSKKAWDKDKERNEGEKRAMLQEGLHDIDFRDAGLLRKYVTQHGKLMPSRLTGVTAKQQRALARAIRRARVLGMMP